MKLNNAQCTLVTENLRLVHKVIHDKVHSPQQLGMFSYDDLFQIGCIGLCKAAATDKGILMFEAGKFEVRIYRPAHWQLRSTARKRRCMQHRTPKWAAEDSSGRNIPHTSGP